MSSRSSEFATVSTDERFSPMNPHTASDSFTIECTEDVVAGDTIVFTERLYCDTEGKLISEEEAHKRSKRHTSSNQSLNRSGIITPRVGGRSNRRIDAVTNSRQPSYHMLGERTIAAHVIRRSSSSSSNLSKTTNNKNLNNTTMLSFSNINLNESLNASAYGGLGAGKTKQFPKIS